MTDYQSHARDRLAQLRKELEAGNLQLENLDKRATELRQTLLRISGAIQVLEELEHSTATDVG